MLFRNAVSQLSQKRSFKRETVVHCLYGYWLIHFLVSMGAVCAPDARGCG